MLLITDLHLTHKPDDEYRWSIFQQVRDLLKKRRQDVGILGDITDHWDSFPGSFVNRLVQEMRELSAMAGEVFVLMGNHDAPKKEDAVPYWKFLNNLDTPVHYITEPYATGGDFPELWLPWTPNPMSAWHGVDFKRYAAVFMHQTVRGAAANSGFKMDGTKVPFFARGCRVFSGDVHMKQQVGAVRYIGASLPIDYGDDYPCAIVHLDNEWNVAKETTVYTLRKHLFRIDSTEELSEKGTRPGDMARVVIRIKASEADKWWRHEGAVEAWAAERKVVLRGVEPEMDGGNLDRAGETLGAADYQPQDDATILEDFAAAEELDAKLVEPGRRYVREVR